MLWPPCGITREQMLVPLSLQSKSSGSAAALALVGLDPNAHARRPAHSVVDPCIRLSSG
jgi:hypothetical protein